MTVTSRCAQGDFVLIATSWIRRRARWTSKRRENGGLALTATREPQIRAPDLPYILPLREGFSNIMGGVYTPVLSIPTWVTSAALSQSLSRSNSAVVVPKVRVSLVEIGRAHV